MVTHDSKSDLPLVTSKKVSKRSTHFNKSRQVSTSLNKILVVVIVQKQNVGELSDKLQVGKILHNANLECK